jgi:hypothetical protein
MINNSRVYVILFVGIILSISAYSQTFDENLKLPKYQLSGNGTSFAIKSGSHKVIRMDHRSVSKVVESDKNFNHAVRRGNTIIATGDVPTFAMLRILQINKLDPDILRLGDGRIGIRYKGKTEWLDEAASIQTLFNPGNTEYNIQSVVFPDLKFKIKISQAYDWGMTVKVVVMNKMIDPADLQITFSFGRSGTINRTFSANYFNFSDKVKDNEVLIKDNIAVLHQKGQDFRAAATTWPGVHPRIIDTTANFIIKLNVNPNKSDSVYFISAQSDNEKNLFTHLNSVPDPELLFSESCKYYADMLAPYSISTPSQILDAGFMTAIVNLDCVYNAGKAWFEGIHWWPAYWTNNFQISAAVSLNQLDRARMAFRFFNTKEGGLCTPLTSSGQPADYPAEDGIPYYIYELAQYIDCTGDTSLLTEIWPALCKGIERIWKVRDDNNNSLINWHLGCNAFLYQADHLALPGDAASPSLMMAAMLEKAAVLAELIGKKSEAEKWRIRSQKIYELVIPELWNKKSGVFYSHVDQQNIAHLCHYYTDMVFPGLYTDLPEIYGWQSLDYLKNSLCFESNSGMNHDTLLLMRVGDLKPTVFGNDNVMPVQMAEAARAFFKTGDNSTGLRMLESVALAGTINTEAPGNFPERMNDYGKGEANYLFGNPIGSFIHGVVNGLFGLSLVKEGRTLEWAPAFPDNWEKARIRLPYATVSYSSAGKETITAIYKADHEKRRSIEFSTHLRPCKVLSVFVNGKPVPYELTPALNKVKVKLTADAALSHEIKIIYQLQNENKNEESKIEEGANASWIFSSDIKGIQDLQDVLKNIKISGNEIDAEAFDNIGHHQFFVKLKNPEIIIPVTLNIEPHFTTLTKTATYNASDKTLKAHIVMNAPSMKEKTGVLTVSLLNHQTEISVNNTDSVSQIIVFKNIDTPAKGIYTAKFSLQDDSNNTFKSTANVYLKGEDNFNDSLMMKIRNRRTEFIDISGMRNSNSIFATSFWRYFDIVADRDVFKNFGDTIKTEAGIFACPKTDNTLVTIEYGKSDKATVQTIRGTKPSVLVFPVNKKIMNLSLLFISEIQSRHTATEVGTIKLYYDNGETKLVPLLTGQNISILTSLFVPELENVFLPIKSWADSWARVLQIPCDGRLTLQSFSIEINAADVEFGLIGASIVNMSY